jgi:hypothetical protein
MATGPAYKPSPAFLAAVQDALAPQQLNLPGIPPSAAPGGFQPTFGTGGAGSLTGVPAGQMTLPFGQQAYPSVGVSDWMARGANPPQSIWNRQLPGPRALFSRAGGVKGLVRGAPAAFGLPIAGAAIGARVAGNDPNDIVRANYGNMLSRMGQYAGIGAGVGSVVPGVGTLVGGVLGGTAGAVHSMLDPFEGEFPTYAKEGESPASMAAVRRHPAFHILKAARDSGIKSQEKRLALVEDYWSRIDEGVKPKKAMRQTLNQIGKRKARREGRQDQLAAQAVMANLLGPLTQNVINEGNVQADIIGQMAGSLPPEFQNWARFTAQGHRTNAANTANAYANQMMMVPYMQALEQQQARDAQLAQQAFQAQLQGQGGGGSANLEELLKAAG